MANHLRANQSACVKSTIHLCGLYLSLTFHEPRCADSVSEKMLGYLSTEIICSEKRTVFRERSSRRTVSFEEQIMSKDKFLSTFSNANESQPRSQGLFPGFGAGREKAPYSRPAPKPGKRPRERPWERG